MKLKQWLASSLRTKLITMFVLLTVIPLIIVGIISYVRSYAIISDNSIASTALVADQLQQDMDNLFEDTRKFMEIGTNPSVKRFLFTGSETYEEAKDILKTFQLYRETYPSNSGILNISIVSTSGKGISERRGVFRSIYDPLENPHFLSLLNNPDNTLLIPPLASTTYDRLDSSETETENRNIVYMAGAIRRQVTSEVIGFIVIDLDATVIEEFSRLKRIGESGFFVVTDDKGRPIFTPDREGAETLTKAVHKDEILQRSSGHFTDYAAGQNLFVVYTTTTVLPDWKIVGIAPTAEITRSADDIKHLILITVAFSLIFTIGLYVFITSRLIRPIEYLKNKMRQAAGGQLEVQAANQGSDEIADLSRSFNTMIVQIRTLLARSVREQEEIKKAELRTLQAQINPHFLYNTLDSIVWMAEAKKSDEVIDLVKALSQFFRITLSKGKDQIPLSEELEHVENYLTIQKKRYRDVLDYRIDVDPELNFCRIPKLTLQPLVENALYHGIKYKRGLGLIEVTGSYNAQGLVQLEVRDNGAGISAERLQELRGLLDGETGAVPVPSEEGSGFGLASVQQRLRLYYGSPYGLEIDSAPGIGTVIRLLLPSQYPVGS